MAKYTELMDLRSDDELRNRITVATTIAANTLLSKTPTEAPDQKWAAAVFSNPESIGRMAFIAVLAANSGATLSQIQSVTDTQIQAIVDKLVPNLVTAFNAV